MNIDEAQGKREDMKLMMKLIKEMKADHEKEEEKKLDRIVALQEKISGIGCRANSRRS